MPARTPPPLAGGGWGEGAAPPLIRDAVADAGAGTDGGGDPGAAAGARHAVAVAARRGAVPAALASVHRPGELCARAGRSGVLGEPGQLAGLGRLRRVAAVHAWLRHRAAAQPQLRLARHRAGAGGGAVGAALGDHRADLDLDARLQSRRAEQHRRAAGHPAALRAVAGAVEHRDGGRDPRRDVAGLSVLRGDIAGRAAGDPQRTLRGGLDRWCRRVGPVPPHHAARPRRRHRHRAAAAHDLGGELARSDPGDDRRRTGHGDADAAAARLPHRLVGRQLRPGVRARGAADAAAVGRGGDLCLAEPRGVDEALEAPARHRTPHRADPRLRAAAVDLDDAVLDPPRRRTHPFADRALAAPAHA